MADDNSYTGAKKSARPHGKAWEVIKSSTKDFQGVIGRGREAKFGKKTGAFITRDANFANELRQKFGWGKGGTRDLIINEIDDPATYGSKNVWSVPELPWKVRDGKEKEGDKEKGSYPQEREEAH